MKLLGKNVNIRTLLTKLKNSTKEADTLLPALTDDLIFQVSACTTHGIFAHKIRRSLLEHLCETQGRQGEKK